MSRFRVIKREAPAHWASYLINGDASGLVDYYGESTDEVDAWLASVGAGGPTDCSDEPHYGHWNGLLTDLLTYTFLVPLPRDAKGRYAKWEAR